MKTSLWFPIVLCSFFGFPSPSFSEVFKYTDEKGMVHYVDAPEKIPSKYRSGADIPADLPKVNKFSAPTFSPSIKSTPVPASSSRSKKKVQVFVTSWCPHCKALEKYLNDNSVSYTKYDIEADPQGKRLYQRLGKSGVPIIQIGQQIIQGFNQEAVAAALALSQ